MRFIGTVILMIAMVAATATGIDRLMIDTQEWITPWMAPNIIDNAHFVMAYGFAMCYMYSDVPFMQKTELYKIVRKGKTLVCRENTGNFTAGIDYGNIDNRNDNINIFAKSAV